MRNLMMVLVVTMMGSWAQAECSYSEALDNAEVAIKSELFQMGVPFVRFAAGGCSDDECRGVFTFKKEEDGVTRDFAGSFVTDVKTCELSEFGWGALGEEHHTGPR